MKRGTIAAVRAFAAKPPLAEERCDFCGHALAESHAHVVDASGAPRCACQACALLFPERRDAQYRRLESHAEKLATEVCTQEQWAALGVPVGLAWLFRDGRDGHVRVQYPGAAGAVEARLDPASTPALATLKPGVEAFLVRDFHAQRECWRVSIDHCWRLAGLLRKHWRGFDGGAEVHARVGAFFKGLADG